jgi:hypothetical protein
VNHGVDVLDRHELADDRCADVGADKLDAAEVAERRTGVDTNDAFDAGSLSEGARNPGSKLTGDTGDEDNPAHGLLAQFAALDARALQHLAVLLLRHPLTTLLDD